MLERWLLARVCLQEMRDFCFTSGLCNSTGINATYSAFVGHPEQISKSIMGRARRGHTAVQKLNNAFPSVRHSIFPVCV